MGVKMEVKIEKHRFFGDLLAIELLKVKNMILEDLKFHLM